MRMLERKPGKPAKQILEEAMEESEEWPMGRYEFENSLGGHESLAKLVIEHFGPKRPFKVTREDVEEFLRQRGGKPISPASRLTDWEVESYQSNIQLVYDIYEDP